jgi:sulfoxide reductase heme-binding subunit YedZ
MASRTIWLAVAHLNKRWRQNIILAGASTLALGIFYFLDARSDWLHRISVATAYTGMGFVTWAMCIGPLNLVRRIDNPIHQPFRRDVGIWGGVISLIHVAVGLQMHFVGEMWKFFVFAPEQWSSRLVPVRYDLFGLANWTGLVATVLLALLLLASNNAAIRRLGRKRWKSVHRSVYVVMVLTLFHGIAYQFLEKRQGLLVIVLISIALTALCVQFLGFRIRRAART